MQDNDVFTWTFRILKYEDGLRLFGDSPYHYTPETIINQRVGKIVVRLNGEGIGVNLKIVDEEAWSDYVSMHVDDGKDGKFVLKLPPPPLKKR